MFIFIFIVSFVLTFLIETMGEERMASLLLKDTFIQPFIAALIGLIPNCAASVMITEAYLGGAITFGSMIAGLFDMRLRRALPAIFLIFCHICA